MGLLFIQEVVSIVFFLDVVLQHVLVFILDLDFSLLLNWIENLVSRSLPNDVSDEVVLPL